MIPHRGIDSAIIQQSLKMLAIDRKGVKIVAVYHCVELICYLCKIVFEVFFFFFLGGGVFWGCFWSGLGWLGVF